MTVIRYLSLIFLPIFCGAHSIEKWHLKNSTAASFKTVSRVLWIITEQLSTVFSGTICFWTICVAAELLKCHFIYHNIVGTTDEMLFTSIVLTLQGKQNILRILLNVHTRHVNGWFHAAQYTCYTHPGYLSETSTSCTANGWNKEGWLSPTIISPFLSKASDQLCLCRRLGFLLLLPWRYHAPLPSATPPARHQTPSKHTVAGTATGEFRSLCRQTVVLKIYTMHMLSGYMQIYGQDRH